ncbi:MAG TPA: hypothetical protein VJ011_13165, partial [Steroidobacteraceae bacterium]|nr:hypothetical protein [Steroidobacteraceae bacterium]
MRRIVLLVVLLAAATATMGSRAAELRAAAGRPVAEVLREASAAGLRIVFSEALVPGDLRVLAEPSATELVARLREILAPH